MDELELDPNPSEGPQRPRWMEYGTLAAAFFGVVALTALAAAGGYSAWSGKTVDAIPDISENQTIVLTEWPGRSPQDVEDQVTYPLSTALAGVKGVKEIRGLSGFGFSQVYVVFEEDIRFFTKGMVQDFYEARTRVLEKLASVQKELPEGVVPELGPDATALGQVFWYTVDGPHDLATLRSVQDFVVRYELQTLPGVAEVASVGTERESTPWTRFRRFSTVESWITKRFSAAAGSTVNSARFRLTRIKNFS